MSEETKKKLVEVAGDLFPDEETRDYIAEALDLSEEEFVEKMMKLISGELA